MSYVISINVKNIYWVTKIILYFQLQNHEYFYKSNPINLHPKCKTKFIILIKSTFLVNLLSYVLEYRNNIVWWVQYCDMHRLVAWGYLYTPIWLSDKFSKNKIKENLTLGWEQGLENKCTLPKSSAEARRLLSCDLHTALMSVPSAPSGQIP